MQADYFLLLVRHDGRFYFASQYAQGMNDVFGVLRERLAITVWSTGLVGSTVLASAILWPSDLSGNPLFKFVREDPQGRRRALWFIDLAEYTCELTDDVKAYLGLQP